MSSSTCALLTYLQPRVLFCVVQEHHVLVSPDFALCCRLSSGYCATTAGIPLKRGCNSGMWASVAAGSHGAAMSDVKPYHTPLSILSGLIKALPTLQIMMGGFSFLLLQKSEGHTSPTWRTAKWNVSGSSAYFLRWPVKLHFIVKHCALPNILALSLPREASQSIWWKL